MQRSFVGTVLVVACLACLGCGQSTAVDPLVLAQRARLLLSQEPAEAVGVLDARENPAEGEMVVFGQIGGVPDPWTAGRAAFVMTDPSAAAAADHECPDGCKFCVKNKNNDALALVKFLDADGRVLSIDARELFNLADREMVVVRGRVQRDDTGALVVAASGLYVRR